jgi:hypothetical protein
LCIVDAQRLFIIRNSARVNAGPNPAVGLRRPASSIIYQKAGGSYKKKLSKLSVLAAAGLFASSTLVSAHHLAAPTNVVCPIVGDVIQANWDDVIDATKYSVNVIATYDTGVSGDPSDDTSMDWDFGTGDRTDELPINQSDLMIPLSALVHDFGTGAGPQSAVAAQLRVKGLHPGKSQERQNNLFSDFCAPAAPTV